MFKAPYPARLRVPRFPETVAEGVTGHDRTGESAVLNHAADIIERVKNTIERHGMIGPGETVLVAVSGGPDSMALLHILRELGHTIEVAHLDHQTRDGASAADAAFVQGQAAQMGLPCHLKSNPVAKEASQSSLSFEEYARNVRYEFLFHTAHARDCAALATGHHANDQVETVLMRFLRGTTARGLAGIPPVGDREGVRLVRPLLDCTREEIEAYVTERGIETRCDHTNTDPRYLRNRIRAELLPQLARDYNPQVDGAILRMSEVLRDENDLLDTLARALVEKCLQDDGTVLRETFAAFHPALQRRAVLILAWQHGIDCPFDRVEAARDFICSAPSGTCFDLGGGVMLRNSRDVTELAEEAQNEGNTEVVLAVPGETTAQGKRFVIRELATRPAADLAGYCSPTRQVFDADVMGARLTVRLRRAGDRFTPFGMTGSKKLKDYFIDLGMPASQRARQVLVLAEDKIAWVV
ncbi:MAG: tRNA lysidine(34) synthetase TilS, partial [bacterium]|nr:tRNA lysidine(34) synthetase TilS [bacterium]